MPDSKLIPVFPLPIVVFPGEEVRLHIFEPRYQQLIRDCEKNKIVFCILPIIENELMKIGTIVSLIEVVKKYEDGKKDIRIQSHDLCECIEFYDFFPSKKYSGIKAVWIENKYDLPLTTKINIQEAFEELCTLNNVKPYHPVDWDSFNCFNLGHFVGFNQKEEYNFKIQSNEIKRSELLMNQIQKMIGETEMRKKWITRMNLNGEFRKLT